MTLSAVNTVKGPIAGLGIELSTLSRLNGNKLLTTKPALMFLAMKAFTHVGLKREVKYFLLIILIPPRSSYSTYSR